jgi:NhaP-type Na+/H+ or K+/H+ antiporter
MRGTVTLAAALALPADFPFRDLVLSTAFGVTVGTLVLQGLTLRPLIVHLKLEDDGLVEREVRLARVEASRAAVSALAGYPASEAASLVRTRYEMQLRRAKAEIEGDGARPDMGATDHQVSNDGNGDAAVVRAAAETQRERLLALRAEGRIGDAAFQRIEEELDWAELGWAQLFRPET